jgi:hypothetical protein
MKLCSFPAPASPELRLRTGWVAIGYATTVVERALTLRLGGQALDVRGLPLTVAERVVAKEAALPPLAATFRAIGITTYQQMGGTLSGHQTPKFSREVLRLHQSVLHHRETAYD